MKCTVVVLAFLVAAQAMAVGGQGIPPQRSRETHKALLVKYHELEAQHVQDMNALMQIREEIDRASGQYYGWASGLYWYTDRDEALAVAKAEKKPVLSLRLLGALTDPLSCANSRFFRTILYSNPEISKYLSENYVLHWESERPVPKVEIDFGDGRKIRTTVTGNSIHYILLPDGSVLDALPGLYGPNPFLEAIKTTAVLAKSVLQTSEPQRNNLITAYHLRRSGELMNLVVSEARTAGASLALLTQLDKAENSPSAAKAAVITESKLLVEAPLVRTVPRKRDVNVMAPEVMKAWESIAALHSEAGELDRAARMLISQEIQTGELAETLENLKQSVALDSVRNEYLLHRTIHQWLAQPAWRNQSELNARVYTELFLTPKSDPWLGLNPKNIYTGLAKSVLFNQ